MDGKKERAWRDVVGRELRTKTREVSRDIKQHGQKKVTRVVTEVTEEPYVIFSCGHELRAIDFDSRGKERKRVICWRCDYGNKEPQ